jgi:tetratricopeptide (TPR) repeat protein
VKLKSMFLIVVMALCLAAPAPAADEMDAFAKRLAGAKDQAEKNEIYRLMGDYLARQGDFGKAAEAYLKALPGIRGSLTEDELTQVAVYLSWAGKLKEAEGELRYVLGKNPDNIRARSQLANVVLWSGDLDGALSEAQTVLEKQPGERNALLIKAEGFRYKGETDRAIELYKGLLEKTDDFDARLGLSYAWLDKGDAARAQAQASLLKPVYPYQKQETEKLNEELKRPRPEIPAAQAPRRETSKLRAGLPLVDFPREGLQKTEPETPLAVLLKQQGDALAEANDHKSAAEKYEYALGLPDSFSVDERIRMATVMSWGGRIKPARAELESILAKDPSNIPARIQLARVKLWMGELDDAIKETDTVLAAQPGNRDALLVKANALRRKGLYRAADAQYKTLLARADDFEVREGRAYSGISSGDRLGADENIGALKPNYSYEKDEYARIATDRDWAFRPRVYAGVSYYDDKDDNRVTTYGAGSQVFLKNWKTNLDYRHFSARGPYGSRESDDVQLSTYSRMPWYGGLGAGIGLAQGRFLTWRAVADFDVLYGSVGLLASEQAYYSSPEVIDRNIRVMNLAVNTVQRVTDRITLGGGYTYGDYSDHNSSNDAQASIAYLVFRKPAIAVGYRFRYLDYRRQSGGGYFDPGNYIADSIFINLSFEDGRWYGYIEPYVGYQTFSRNDDNTSEVFYGAAGSLGYRVTGNFAVEAAAEWGNYGGSGVAAGGDSGWYYYQAGLRLIYLF